MMISKISRLMPKLCRLPLLLITAFAGTSTAHGFGQRYDLPLPLGIYLTGAALAVAFSFVVMFFLRRADTRTPLPVNQDITTSYPRFNLLNQSLICWIANPWFVFALRTVSVSLLVLLIVAGLWGVQSPFNNITPTIVWVIWWVGLAYFCGLAGNLWAILNPWSVSYRWGEMLWLKLLPSRPFGLTLPWPRYLGCWPAIVLFVWFIWAELIWPHSDTPASLANATLTYSLVTWLGMLLFGRHQWLNHGETFSIIFSLLARFSATEFRVSDARNLNSINELEDYEQAEPKNRQLNLRPWAVGLLTVKPVSVSMMVFVLLMLSSVTFDGLLATPLWGDIAQWMIYSQALRPLIIVFQELTGDALSAVATIALLFFLVAFQLLYLLFSALMLLIVPATQRVNLSTLKVARFFVLSFIPISLAYHLAHYLSYLAIVGQYIIPLASDPFGFGWDLFGTGLYRIDISVVNAKLIWYISVIAIVIGHIIAVWLSHVTAQHIFATNRGVLISQIPMVLLMVAYTVLSLWILAQPVIEL